MVTLWLSLVLIGAGFSNPPLDRAGFVQALRTLKTGASTADVLRLLGPPDDVLTSEDPFFYLGRCDEVWAYGTNGHRSFPTLGRVAFVDRKVRLVHGTRGNPPSPDLIDEATLKRGLRALDRPLQFGRFEVPADDPLWLIRTANALIPLGKSKAMAVLHEFARLAHVRRSSSENAPYYLLRVIFEVPDPPGFMRIPGLGLMRPDPPLEQTVIPRFPIALADDIPFSLYLGSFFGGGGPESLEEDLTALARTCEMRRTQLRPPDDPFPSFLDLFASPQWPTRLEMRSGLGTLLLLVRTAYRPAEATELRHRPGNTNGRHHAEFLATKAHWDPSKQCYVRRDGSFDTDPTWTAFEPVRWDFRSGDDLVVFQMARLDEQSVALEIFAEGGPYSVEYTTFNAEGRRLASGGQSKGGPGPAESNGAGQIPNQFELTYPSPTPGPKGGRLTVKVKLGGKEFTRGVSF